MRLCVVIPVYNSPYINEVIKDVMTFGYEIIVVDDGSSDNIKIDNPNIHLITHKTNLGKGEAILSGAKKAKELGYKSFVTMDADKQHISSQISKLSNVFESNTIVIGSRNLEDENVPKSSIYGRKFSNFWVNLETFKNLKDTQSGFRIYPVSILELKTKEVDVECHYPSSIERISHFNKWKDNLRLSIIHTKLMIQRYLLLRGFLWN